MRRRLHPVTALLLGLPGFACGGSAPPAEAPVADAGVTPPAADAGPAVDAWPAEWSAHEAQVLELVNAHRAAGANCGGLAQPQAPPLEMNAALRTAARLHSQDMARQDYFSHTSRDGRSPFERIAAAGFTGMPQGENIAGGQTSAEQTVDGWMNSPGHCRNIMDPRFTQLGVGYAFETSSTLRHYWTQTFGGP